MPGLSRNQAYSVKVIIPDKKIIKMFVSLITPHFKSITIFKDNIKKLAQLRDLLIPQLVSGKR